MKKFKVSVSKTHGKGLFATTDIKKNQFIWYIQGTRIKKIPKTRKECSTMQTWFGLSRYLWIDPGTNAFRYLNHACEPNAAIVGTKTLVAMRPIRKGEEITIDYSMTDAEPLWDMKCSCGAKRCRKVIRSIQTVPLAVYQRHLPYVPKYFQQAYVRARLNLRVQSKGKEF
jgi:uncharacterized protein